MSAVKERIRPSQNQTPTSLPCLKCKGGEWKFIGSDGGQFVHFCTNCGHQDKFYHVYGMTDPKKFKPLKK